MFEFVPCARTQCTRDILSIADPWATVLSPLELQNAETKRVAEKGSTKHIEFGKAEGNKALIGLRKNKQGPMQLKDRKQYSTTMALCVMKNLLSSQKLRRGMDPRGGPHEAQEHQD